MSQQIELKTERFQIMMDRSTQEAVDNWRFSNRIGSKAEAIRRLIHLGIEFNKSQTETADARA